MVPESSIAQVAIKEKSNMERVLQEIDGSDSLPRTERKLSRAVSFAPVVALNEASGAISLSNKLMSSFNGVAVAVEQAENDSGAGVGDAKE
jgi:hypothetical protein